MCQWSAVLLLTCPGASWAQQPLAPGRTCRAWGFHQACPDGSSAPLPWLHGPGSAWWWERQLWSWRGHRQPLITHAYLYLYHMENLIQRWYDNHHYKKTVALYSIWHFKRDDETYVHSYLWLLVMALSFMGTLKSTLKKQREIPSSQWQQNLSSRYLFHFRAHLYCIPIPHTHRGRSPRRTWNDEWNCVCVSLWLSSSTMQHKHQGTTDMGNYTCILTHFSLLTPHINLCLAVYFKRLQLNKSKWENKCLRNYIQFVNNHTYHHILMWVNCYYY